MTSQEQEAYLLLAVLLEQLIQVEKMLVLEQLIQVEKMRVLEQEQV
jgi:hypothetical protein